MLKNINWKVRLKNPTFWIQLVIALVSPILVGLGVQWQDMTTWAALWLSLIHIFTKDSIIRLEAGPADPKLSTLLAIADALHVPCLLYTSTQKLNEKLKQTAKSGKKASAGLLGVCLLYTST